MTVPKRLSPVVAFLIIIGLSLTAHAAEDTRVRSATRSITPASPVYAGVNYTLTLSIVTEEDCEIGGFYFKNQPAEQPDSLTSTIANGLRTTNLAWHLTDERPKLVAFPEETLILDLVRAHQAGFMRLVRKERTSTKLPAFSYDVIPLPSDAEGLPAGSFSLTLTADRLTYVPGDVRKLRAEFRSLDGSLIPPLTFEPDIPEDAGIFYPFRSLVTEPDTPKHKRAVAYFVANSDKPITLKLKPLKIFDPEKRTVRELTAPSLILRPVEDDTNDADTEAPASDDRTPEGNLLLRFAPDPRAPTLGTVPPESLAVEAEHEGWLRVRAPDGTAGWLRKSTLENPGNANPKLLATPLK